MQGGVMQAGAEEVGGAHGAAHGPVHGVAHGAAHGVADGAAHGAAHGTAHGVAHTQPFAEKPQDDLYYRLSPVPVMASTSTDATPAPRPMTGVERSMCRGSVWPADCQVPEHGSVVNGALFFRRLPAIEAITAELCSVFSSHVRFQSLAKEDGTWEAAALDLSYHFVQEAAVISEADARRVVEDIVQQDLDHSHPLWRVHVVPVQDRRGLSIVVLRIHHCIGDGFAVASIFHSLARSQDGEPVGETALMRKLERERQHEQQTCALATACHRVARGADRVRSLASNSSVPFRA